MSKKALDLEYMKKTKTLKTGVRAGESAVICYGVYPPLNPPDDIYYA